MTAGLRLLGAGLLGLAGALIGLRKKAELAEKKRCLEEIASGLELMESELAVLRTPLPEILERLTDCRFFRFVSAGFGGEPLEALWERAAMAQPIPPEARRVLAELGRSLGRYDAERQCGALALTRRRLSLLAGELGQELSQRGRIFPGLGAALGAILGTMLF